MTKIDVTQEDIDLGIISSACGCPVALALQRIAGDVGGPIVNKEDITLWKNNVLTSRHKTPDSVKEFIEKFDAQAEVSPFSFELDINITKEI